MKPPLSGAPRPAGWHGSARHGSHDLGANTSYPLIVGGRVFVAALHGSVYGPVLYAFDLATGAELWSRRLGGDASITVAAPILVGSTVYTAVSSPGRVIALDADTGEILDEELVGGGVPTLADDGGSGGLGAGDGALVVPAVDRLVAYGTDGAAPPPSGDPAPDDSTSQPAR